MHTNNTYRFDNEADAAKFAEGHRASKCPSEDKYVTGPIFMDGKQIFKNMDWVADYNKTWWQVSVEVYY